MNNHNRIFRILVLGVYFLAFWIVISRNLDFEYLWFDEAGQFWISKGLNHDSAPLSAEGGVADVIENNKYYNMDPGGFGILLHFWSAISNHHDWLRLLPFIFFIGVVIGFIYLSYSWLKNLDIALLMGFIPILVPMVLNMGFEVRAYSMETLGTVLCVVALQKMRNNLEYKTLFFWGCIFSLFMTSRYSSVVVVFVTSVYVLILIILRNYSLKEKALRIGAYALPLLISLAYIFIFSFRYQNDSHDQLPYLQFLSNNPLVLFRPFNFLFIVSIGLCTLLFFARKRYQILNKYAPLLFVAIGVNVLFIVLSLMGIHPWRIAKSCISMVILILLCFSFLFGKLLRKMFNLNESVKYYTLAILSVFVVYERNDTLYPRFDQDTNICFGCKKIDMSTYPKIYVECWEAPCIRYLFEYGSMKNELGKSYPKQFTFAKGVLHSNYSVKDSMIAWSSRAIKMDELTEYDLIITSKLWDWSSKNHDKWKLMANTTNLWIKREDSLLINN